MTLLPTDTFKSIIDQAVEMGFTGNVCLQHFNEPLLDVRLAELAEYVKSRKEITGLLTACTNADLMTPELAETFDGLFDQFTVALYMEEPMKSKRAELLLSMFKKTELYFTEGAHHVTHFSPFTNLDAAITDCADLPCTSFNSILYIACDGTILQCCEDYVGHFDLGNVHTSTIKEIWESETYMSLIDDLSEAGGRRKHEYCTNCPRYT
jgi:radical SAM protein with 4Fe4S-binding SPASM domain